ncbi:hypothetical protein GUJ93_ZPchr0014g46802 [Zizania palustris]|uniref:Uncharacterized protein n=1 Tax=Zizania palustris TaxID=103762 RepID=A0A8J5W5Q3_ZIZPA|nr:hypothetical protein GUJ93_ZPchr0014g46802 [Zizania palustris]
MNACFFEQMKIIFLLILYYLFCKFWYCDFKFFKYLLISLFISYLYLYFYCYNLYMQYIFHSCVSRCVVVLQKAWPNPASVAKGPPKKIILLNLEGLRLLSISTLLRR